MKPLFADTFYWLALLNPGDNWHQTVLNYTHQHLDQELVTSDGVLDEMLNYASTRGIVMREKALALYAYVIRSPLITIIPYTPNLREKGLELYAKRSDKSYSITDCISMVIMKQLGIQDILTHDKHFTQEGFTIIFTTMY